MKKLYKIDPSTKELVDIILIKDKDTFNKGIYTDKRLLGYDFSKFRYYFINDDWHRVEKLESKFETTKIAPDNDREIKKTLCKVASRLSGLEIVELSDLMLVYIMDRKIYYKITRNKEFKSLLKARFDKDEKLKVSEIMNSNKKAYKIWKEESTK